MIYGTQVPSELGQRLCTKLCGLKWAVIGEERKLTCEKLGEKKFIPYPTPTPVQKILNIKTKPCWLGLTKVAATGSGVSVRPVLKECTGHAQDQRARHCSAKLPGSPQDSETCPS